LSRHSIDGWRQEPSGKLDEHPGWWWYRSLRGWLAEEVSALDEQPIVGAWYETDEGETFVVLAVDGEKGVVDVQYLGGEVDQFDREVWAGLVLRSIEPPEEWRSSMDELFPERWRKK
jgi:hypothetical protein